MRLPNSFVSLSCWLVDYTINSEIHTHTRTHTHDTKKSWISKGSLFVRPRPLVSKKVLTVTERRTNLSRACRPQTPKCHRLPPASFTTPMLSVHASMLHKIQHITPSWACGTHEVPLEFKIYTNLATLFSRSIFNEAHDGHCPFFVRLNDNANSPLPCSCAHAT